MTADEEVREHLRPHWKVMILPTLVLLLAVAASVAAYVWLDAVIFYIVAAVALIGFGWLSFWPWLTWRTTHYIFTNERIIFQLGVFSRERRDIPLMRVNDHQMNQSLIERILGCGTLTIESAGERGQSVLHDIPKIEQIQTMLYSLVEADRDAHSYNDDERPAFPTQTKREEEAS